MSKKTRYLISYDIGNPKRLSKIHRFLKKHAIPIQYSVFYAKLTIEERKQLLEALEQKINPKEDDIRCYPLAPKVKAISYGTTFWVNNDYIHIESIE